QLFIVLILICVYTFFICLGIIVVSTHLCFKFTQWMTFFLVCIAICVFWARCTKVLRAFIFCSILFRVYALFICWRIIVMSTHLIFKFSQSRIIIRTV